MAHKKGGGSSTNGRDSNAQRLGVKAFAGELVTGGSIIIRQRGTKIKPGAERGHRLGRHAVRQGDRPREVHRSRQPRTFRLDRAGSGRVTTTQRMQRPKATALPWPLRMIQSCLPDLHPQKHKWAGAYMAPAHLCPPSPEESLNTVRISIRFRAGCGSAPSPPPSPHR